MNLLQKSEKKNKCIMIAQQQDLKFNECILEKTYKNNNNNKKSIKNKNSLCLPESKAKKKKRLFYVPKS